MAAKRVHDAFDGGSPDKLSKDKASVLAFDNYRRAKKNVVDPRQSKWREDYQKYRSHISESQDSGLMNELFIPLTFSHTESYAPAIVKNRPRIEVWGRGEEDADRAASLRALLEYDWEALSMPVELVNFAKSSLIYGTAWWKVTRKLQGSDRTVRFRETVPITIEIDGEEVPVPGQTQEVVKEEERFIVDWDGPDVELCEIDAVFPDPDARSMKDLDANGYVIHEVVRTLQEIEAALDEDGEPLYDKTAVSKLKKASDKMNQFENEKQREKLVKEMVEKFGGASMINPDPHKRQFHLLEMWTKDWVTVVVREMEDKDNVPPLRNDPNPLGMLPFVIYTPIPLPNELYGISLPETLWALNHELNVLHGARMDNIMLSIHRMYKIMRGGGVNPRHLRSRPGGIVWVDDMQDIEPFETQPMEFTPYREAEEIRFWAQQSSGVTDIFQGLQTQGVDTATQANLLDRNSASRASLMFLYLTEQALKRLGKLLIRVHEISAPQEMSVRVGGSDFEDVQYISLSPEDFYTHSGVDFDVVIDVAATEPSNREFRLNRAIQAFQTIGGILPPEHPLMERFMIMLAEGLGIDRAENVLEEGREVLAQLRAQEQAAEQAGQGPEGASSIADLLAVDQSAPFGGGEGA